MANIDAYFEPPNRHWGIKKCTFDSFEAADGNQKRALTYLKTLDAGSGQGVYLYDPSGRGKSHLLVASARRFKENGKNVSYCSGGKFWKAISKRGEGLFYSPENKIVSADVVIIDDIDIDYNSALEAAMFYNFINTVYDNATLTLISSNHSPEVLVKKMVVPKDKMSVKTATGGEILQQFGTDDEMQARTLDRLNEMCLFIDLSDAPGFRTAIQEGYRKEHLG